MRWVAVRGNKRYAAAGDVISAPIYNVVVLIYISNIFIYQERLLVLLLSLSLIMEVRTIFGFKQQKHK